MQPSDVIRITEHLRKNKYRYSVAVAFLLISFGFLFNLFLVPPVKGTSDICTVNSFDSTYTDWITNGASPYLNTVGGGKIFIADIGFQEGWFGFADTTASSGTVTATLKIYTTTNYDPYDYSVYVDYSGGAGTVYSLTALTSWAYQTVNLGSLTVAQANALRIYLVSGSDEGTTTIDYAFCYFNYTASPPSYHPPVIGTPSPVNGTTGQPISFSWSVPITDAGGTFDWTIQCNNTQSSSANGASNGTKSLSLTGLSYNHPYKVWVNATDGVNTTRKWFTFTTVADTTPPTSSVNTISPYWKTSSPLTITATASDSESGVKNVTLFYRYASDNSTWGSWTSYGVDTASPWSWSFTFPSGAGYYQFYTRAHDNSSNYESAPGSADQICGYDITAPASSVNAITPYWKSSSPLTIIATATDSISGVKNVTLFYRFSSNNGSWGSWTSFGIDTASPWSWSFTFPGGVGYYQFYTRAYDNATNYEAAPGSADQICGYLASITITHPYPTGFIKTSTTAINGRINSSAGLRMNVSLWSNITTGVWHKVGYYPTVTFLCDYNHDTAWNSADVSDWVTHNGFQNNGTWAYYLNATSFGTLSNGIKYWYSFNVTDGIIWKNHTFNFTADFSPPVTTVTAPASANMEHKNSWLWINATITDLSVKNASLSVWAPMTIHWTDLGAPTSWSVVGTTAYAGWNTTFYVEGYSYDYRIYAMDTAGNGAYTSGGVLNNHTWDATPPISSVDAISYWHSPPTTITATASDVLIGVYDSGVKNVTLFYRFSSNNISWGSWTSYGVDLSSPWSWSFTFPNGAGYYQFYTRAYDNVGNYETAPGSADQICGYDNLPPTTSISHITPYWHATYTCSITVTYADNGPSGMNQYDIYMRYAPDNSTWGAWYLESSYGPTTSPTIITVNFIYGVSGYYQLYSIGTDNCGNIESAPGSADAIAGCSIIDITTSNPANNSAIPLANNTWSVYIHSAIDPTFDWTIQGACLNPPPSTPPGYNYWHGNTSGINETTGWKTSTFGGWQTYNNSFIVWVNATDGVASAKAIYYFHVEPNYPPVFITPTPLNNSVNNSITLTWTVTVSDSSPPLLFNWSITVYNEATHILFDSATSGYGVMNPSIVLFGLTQTTWYDVYVTVTDYADGSTRHAMYRFQTTNYGAYAGWWDNDWKAKKLLKWNVNETEAENLQVHINLSKGTYGASDDYTTDPPCIIVNSTNLGECRFIATYWDTSTSTWGYTELNYFVELWKYGMTIYYGRDFNLPYSTSKTSSILSSGITDRYGNIIKTQNVPYLHVWIKLPPSIVGTKQYNRTAGEIWVYYKNMNYYPNLPSNTNALTLGRSSGNDTFIWYRGFNEWMNPSEWFTQTYGGFPASASGKWVTKNVPALGANASDSLMGKRLGFVQTVRDWDYADNVHYHDLFYVGNGITLDPLNALRVRLSAYQNDIAGSTGMVPYTTTIRVYSDPTYNGKVQQNQPTYNAAWTAATGTVIHAVDNTIGQAKAGSNYHVYRPMLYFDTSSIPVGSTINNATLYWNTYDDSSATDFNIVVTNGQPTYPHIPLETGDYNKAYYSGNGGQGSTTGLRIGTWNALSLTDLSYITPHYWTKLALRSSRDISGTAPTGDEWVDIRNDAGYLPYLDITYTYMVPSVTNHSHIITITGDTNDGFMTYGGSGYAFVRDHTTGTVYDSIPSTDPDIYIGQSAGSSGNYYIHRGMLFFDTYSIPIGSTINSASLHLYGYKDDSITDFTVTVQNGQPIYPHYPMTTGDYLRTQYSGTGGTLATTGFILGGWNIITLNPTGLGWINMGGMTKLSLRSSRDISGTAPTYPNTESVGFSCADYGYNQPYITINYTAPTPGGLGTGPPKMYERHNTGGDIPPWSHPTEIYGTTSVTQEVTPGTTSDDLSIIVNTVKLNLYRLGNPGLLSISIRQIRDGPNLATETINANTFTTSTSGAWYNVSFTSPATVALTTHFYIVLTAPTGTPTNEVLWVTDAGSPGTMYDAAQIWRNNTKWEYHNSGDDTYRPVYGVNWYAQEVNPGTVSADTNAVCTVTKIRLLLYRVGNPGTMTVYLRTDINGANVATATINANTFTTSTSGEWYNITFTIPSTMTTANYYIVIGAPTGTVTNYVGWRCDTGAFGGTNYDSMYSYKNNSKTEFWGDSGDIVPVDDDYTEVYGPLQIAQEVAPGTKTGTYMAITVTQVMLHLYRVGSPGTLYVYIRTTPTGPNYGTGTINGNTLSTDTHGVWYNISISSTHTVGPAHYYIVLQAPTGSPGNCVGWCVDSDTIPGTPNYDSAHLSRSLTLSEHWNYGTWDVINGPDTYTPIYGTTNVRAQEIVPGTTSPNIPVAITAVKLLLYKHGSPGSIQVSIRLTKTGTDLGTITYNANDLTSSVNGLWYYFFLSSTVNVPATTHYFIVIKVPSGDASNYVGWNLDTGTWMVADPHYAPGNGWLWKYDGSTWSEWDNGVPIFYSHGTGMFEVLYNGFQVDTYFGLLDNAGGTALFQVYSSNFIADNTFGSFPIYGYGTGLFEVYSSTFLPERDFGVFSNSDGTGLFEVWSTSQGGVPDDTHGTLWLQASHSGIPYNSTKASITMTTAVNSLDTAHFYNLLWLKNGIQGTQFIKVANALDSYEEMTTASHSWSTDYGTLNTLGFRMTINETLDMGCSRDWGWTQKYSNVSSLWQDSQDFDIIGHTSNIETDYAFIYLAKYIPKDWSGSGQYLDPPMIPSISLELPYFLVTYPTDGAHNIPINPTLIGKAMGGFGGLLKTDWQYQIVVGGVPVGFNIAQTNYSMPNAFITWNGTNAGVPLYTEYAHTYVWRANVSDVFGNTYLVQFTFTTEDMMIANFTWTIIDYNNRHVQFNDTSTSTLKIDYWNWIFAHGTQSNKQNPYHTFGTAGNWSVSLEIENKTTHRRASVTKYVNLTQPVVPITYLINLDWGMFVPWMYLIIAIVLIYVICAYILRLTKKDETTGTNSLFRKRRMR